MKPGEIIEVAHSLGMYLDGTNTTAPLWVLKPEELIRFAEVIADRNATSEDHRPSTDRAAVVSDSYHWRTITNETPRGRKLMLINKNAGVACIGSLDTNPWFWTHWAPLPTFA